MGQHNSNFELASEARRAAERFDECEIKVIRETFKELCHLNGGSTRIDKETFLQYLPLPGLLGERLFAVFDKKCSGEIDYEEFVCGLAVTCRGSWEEKVEFIFNIYDVHQQGAVNRDELAALLNHVPKSIMRFGRAVSLDGTDSHTHHHHHPAHHHHHRHHDQQQRRSTAPARHSTPSSTVTASGLSAGNGSGRCSPDRSSTGVYGSGSTAAIATTVMGVRETPLGVGSGAGAEGTGSVDPDAEAGTTTTLSSGAQEAPLTSGNLMQLHLASLEEDGPALEPTAGAGGKSDAGSGSSPAGAEESAGTAASPLGFSVPEMLTSGLAVASPPSAGGAEAPPDYAIAIVAHDDDVTGGHEAGGLPLASTESIGGDTEVLHTSGGAGGGGGAASPSGGLQADAGKGAGSEGAGGGSTPSAVSGGGSGVRAGSGMLHSDESTDDGTSAAAPEHPHHAHWEEFTNNDIVDQAFEDCDLNHNGKLSFNEFRLWVERNPIVTQFLQSVFPYDEHREWGDDRKHLPFIHNREFGGSPMMSDAGVSAMDGDNSDDETRRLLIKARNTTRNPVLQDGIDRLIEQAAGVGGDVGSGAEVNAGGVGAIHAVAFAEGQDHIGEASVRNSRRYSGGGGSGASTTFGLGFMSELSPRSARVLQHQTVVKQGFLWKQGHRLKTWKQRWYVLVGNCIYYYQHEDDVYPCGVKFLTGSFVEPLQEGAVERKGYWGIEISRTHEQNHRRRLYTRSKSEQLKWIKELRKASAVVPIEDDFEIGEELGKGRFSRVCMCVNKHTLERKAVKIIMKEEMRAEEKDLLTAEIAIMKLVNHPNIIRMEAVYESKKDIFIVMELHSGGELFDRIVGRPRFTEDEAFTVIHPLVESVAYLHEMGIVHRDLKPENILCGSRIGDIKIADFGLSKMVMPDEIMKMPCGTLTYVAPEVLTLNGYGKEADIWSVGTIMYLLLRGRLPFDGETREEIIENTIHATLAWQNDHVWAGFSDDAKDLVLGMLNKDVSRRCSAKDVLRHPWITQRVQRQEEHPEEFEF